jgi:hypothetical protein
MSGALSGGFGTFRPNTVGVRELAKVQVKTDGTNNLTSGTIDTVAGKVYLVLLAWDPSGSSVPTVTLSDGTNTYTSLLSLYQAPTTTSAGTGVITQVFRMTAGVSAPRTITATFSASIVAKIMIVLELTNGSTTQSMTSVSFRGGSSTVVSNGTVTPSGSLNLAMVAWESPRSAVSGNTPGVAGSWSPISQITTTGDADNTNIGLGYQFRSMLAQASPQITWTLGATPNNWNSRLFCLSRGTGP